MRFEWDDQKAVANFEKHGVSFGEATEVFYDPNALEGYDLDGVAQEVIHQSAKRTSENSPALECWDSQSTQKNSPSNGRLKHLVIGLLNRKSSRPFHGLRAVTSQHPSTEVLGYFHSSASRTGAVAAYFV